jgi:hypothetical protein
MSRPDDRLLPLEIDGLVEQGRKAIKRHAKKKERKREDRLDQ